MNTLLIDILDAALKYGVPVYTDIKALVVRDNALTDSEIADFEAKAGYVAPDPLAAPPTTSSPAPGNTAPAGGEPQP